ncbi:magnesium/cobalt efflux protein, partial [Treponema pallidum]
VSWGAFDFIIQDMEAHKINTIKIVSVLRGDSEPACVSERP